MIYLSIHGPRVGYSTLSVRLQDKLLYIPVRGLLRRYINLDCFQPMKEAANLHVWLTPSQDLVNFTQ